MTTVLITGASGFVGRHVLPKLVAKGFEIHATYSKQEAFLPFDQITWHHINLLNREATSHLVEMIKPTHLLHLAWYAKPGEYWSSPINIDWVICSLNLLNAFATHGGQRAVFIGTCAEYIWNNTVLNEDNPCLPSTLYGRSKYSLYLMSELIAKNEQVSFAWARLFFLFGKHEYTERLVATVINSFLKAIPFTMHKGHYLRDYLYVQDAANALVALLISKYEGAINIASGTPLLIKDIVAKIADKLNAHHLLSNQSIDSPLTPNDLIIQADTGRLRREVGWQAQYTIDYALDETISWWKQNTI